MRRILLYTWRFPLPFTSLNFSGGYSFSQTIQFQEFLNPKRRAASRNGYEGIRRKKVGPTDRDATELSAVVMIVDQIFAPVIAIGD
jgi:hypothetical protein